MTLLTTYAGAGERQEFGIIDGSYVSTGVLIMSEIRCTLCGRSPEGDPEYAMKAFQHREGQKEGRVKGPLVYICPVCAGRSRYEAQQNGRSLSTPKKKDV